MELLVVATDVGVSVFNPSNKQELLKFSASASAVCIVDDELVVSHTGKPLLFCYKLHRSQQAPRKIVMPGRVTSLCPSPIGKYLFGGIGGSLYSWNVKSGRCLQSVQTHYQDVSIIRCNQDFLTTGSHDGQIGVFATRMMLDVHQTVKPLVVINAHGLPITDIAISSDLIFSSSMDFTVKIWNLESLKMIKSNATVKQGKLFVTSIEYPSAISSIACDGVLFRLLASSTDGRIYKTAIQSEMQNATRQPVDQSNWRHDPVVNSVLIEMGVDGTECFTASGTNIKIWEVTSGALIRTINLNGSVKAIHSTIDKWAVSLGGLKSGKEKGSEIEKLLHIPSKDDVLLSADNIRKTNCPLLDVAMQNKLPWDVQSHDDCIQMDDVNQTKEIERLKRLNASLYSQLIEKAVQLN